MQLKRENRCSVTITIVLYNCTALFRFDGPAKVVLEAYHCVRCGHFFRYLTEFIVGFAGDDKFSDTNAYGGKKAISKWMKLANPGMFH